MLSPLSRGYGTWSGRVEYSQPNGLSRENTFPSIGERNLTGISLSASIGTKASAPTAPLQPLQPHPREHSYGEMYLPKTYLTRKGALLLFTAPESEIDDSDFNARWQRQQLYKMRRDRVAKLIDLSLRLGNLTRLSNSVLQYGTQDFDPENASISDEKNKQFLKFLQNLDQKEIDTHVKPGGDLEFYLRDLKSRGSARYVVSGDTYLPKSRISQELQSLLHGLDANCPPSFSQEATILGERSHSRLSDQFTRPVSRASSRAQSPGSAHPSTPKSYNVLSCKKLTASIKSSNYLGRPSSTEPLQEDPPVQDAIGVGISPAEEGTDGSGLEGYISPLTRKLFRMPGTQPSVAGSSITEEEESLDHLSRTLKERATSPGMPLIYEVTGEESEDEDKVDEVLLERFRKGGSLFSMQSEEVLTQYQETIPPPSERDNLERQNEDHISKIETKEEEVKRPQSAKRKASVSSRSSSASRPTSARQIQAQSVPSRPSSAMNRNMADKLEAEEIMNQSIYMVPKELVENKGMVEVLEKELVENKDMVEVLEKELVENEGMVEVFKKALVENKGMVEVLEKELVENEGIKEVFEKKLVENEGIYEVLEKHTEVTEANTLKPLMSEIQVASIGEEKRDDEGRDAKNNEKEITANKIIEVPNNSLKPQNMNKDEKQIISLLETKEVSAKSEVASMKITEGDTKVVSTENNQTYQEINLEPVKGQDVNTNGKAMLDVPENKTDHQNYLSEIPITEKPVQESNINHMDQNITDLKSGKKQLPPSSKLIKLERHSTLGKITAKTQEYKKLDIRKPVITSPVKRNDAKSKMNMKVNIDSNSSSLKQRVMTQVLKKDEANNLDGASKELETETDASSKSELSHLTQLAQSIGGKVPKAPGKGKKLMGVKKRQKSSTSLDKTDTVSETTSSVGSKKRDSLKIPEHMKDALTRRPSLSKEELEKEMERRGLIVNGKVSELVDATLSGPTLHSIGEGLTEEELELAKQILQEKLAAAKEKIDDPKGQGKKSPVNKSASSRKSKKKEEKSDIEKEQEAIRERHEREKKKWKRGLTLVIGMKNREEEVRALQEKIAERKAMLKQQKDLNEAKTKELQEEMDRLQQEADEIQRTEDDVRAQLTEMKRKQREERQARKNEMLEKKKQEIAAKREKERKEAEEKRKKEQEMHEKIADAEMRRRLREEEERNREEEERLAEERYMEEIKEQQRLAEEEEERARELERQAEEEAMQRLVEERNEAERQKRMLMEEKMRMEEELLREQAFELERQRQLEEEERKRLEEEQARKDQEMARITELRMMEEKAKAEMQLALEQKRTEAILRRDKNLEARQNISQLRYRQAITRAWVFSYFVKWPRETFEQPIGGKPKNKRMPRAKTPKPDSGAQKPS
ncbi:hypothetical protein CHS0354_039562 [Potamilus streckersoni]|uniref:Uncharacterized protein n=1 Tax=Potamilus streckersoni TaxID=2493646 RepID=A0AAE0SVE7_9BIVA|nr:hypothetical protein CHS0354_039562 [Potamilus streckersoni]